jgi:hypothetical protein
MVNNGHVRYLHEPKRPRVNAFGRQQSVHSFRRFSHPFKYKLEGSST